MKNWIFNTLKQVKFLVKVKYWFLNRFRQVKYKKQLQTLSLIGDEPTYPNLVSQVCTQRQMQGSVYKNWCQNLKIDGIDNGSYRRKDWEHAYIIQALKEQGKLNVGEKGLGFGVGKEPLVAGFANLGCHITATDLPPQDAKDAGWVDTDQYAPTLDTFNEDAICPGDKFKELVSFEYADMNHIDDHFKDFDFVWSSCSLEHLGSIQKGIDFIINAMGCLKPGGIAVHTTEFNLSSNEETVDNNFTVLFRKQDLLRLESELKDLGYWVAPFNFHPGTMPLDYHVDIPPYILTRHLKLLIEGHAVTSIGLIVKKM